MLLALPLVAAIESYYGESDTDASFVTDSNLSTEVSKLTDKHQTLPSSLKGANSQNAHPLHSFELSPKVQSSVGRLPHEQHDAIMVDASDKHLVSVDIYDDPTSVDQLDQKKGCLPTSDSLIGRRTDDSLKSEASPTWRAHHQDFYISKWFRSIQIFIIVSVILVALVLYLFVSPVFDFDLFGTAPPAFLISTMTFLSPVSLLFCIVVLGIFRSKISR